MCFAKLANLQQGLSFNVFNVQMCFAQRLMPNILIFTSLFVSSRKAIAHVLAC